MGLDSPNNVIEGNFIGVGADGKTPLGNGSDGVIAHNDANDSTIGGSAAGAGNVISGNKGNGINFDDTTGNLVEGDFIGTDSTGTKAVPNQEDGVIVQDNAGEDTIGGTVAGLGNLISGNGANGVEIYGTDDNLVEGNLIGSDHTGTLALGNGVDGVNVDGDADSGSNTIGGAVSGAANVLSYNKGYGVAFENSDPTTVLSNSIYQNTSGGIGVTTAPAIPTIALSQLAGSASGPTVGVTIANATPSGSVLIQFFSNPSGTQGATLIDSVAVSTNASGAYSNGELLLFTSPSPGTVLTATVTNGSGFVVTSAFSNALAVPKPTAALVGTNTSTQGNWIGVYGSQAYWVVGNSALLYSNTVTSSAPTYTWTTNTTDPRSLQDPGGVGRIAAALYSNTSFTVNVSLSDTSTHDLELYFLDWDKQSRRETIQILNPVTGTVLDTEAISSFSGGEYLNWAVSGNFVIKITNNSGPNAVLSGLFIDPAQAPTSSTATFVKSDTATQGNWIGVYGTTGYEVIGNSGSLPSYATVTPSGQTSYTWAASTTDPRALQDAGGVGRTAAAWYSKTSFTVDVNLTDGKTHDLELYFLDWDNVGRSEQIVISSEATGTAPGHRVDLVVQ